ncbi:MAG: HpaII family restriction endonuclease, partial [Clostridia bacterium]|nr:HpaII family restriction endonuclease [Clostridia bacterium]
TPSAEASEQTWPVAMIQRIEHDGARRYYIEPADVRIVYGDVDKHTALFTPKSDMEEVTFAREEFADAAAFVWTLLKEGRTVEETGEVEVPDELEAFLDEVRIYDLEAKTEALALSNENFWGEDLTKYKGLADAVRTHLASIKRDAKTAIRGVL